MVPDGLCNPSSWMGVSLLRRFANDAISPRSSVPEVIAAGKAYGVTPEDMFGCLYFFLSQQLRLFHKRLHHMKISIRVQNAEARQLASNIDNNLGFAGMNGLNTTNGFDRIMVSNIVDHNYLGAKETLRSWAPLLSKKKGAVILGYFMNWPELQPDGSAAGISESQQGPIRALFNRKYNVCATVHPSDIEASVHSDLTSTRFLHRCLLRMT